MGRAAVQGIERAEPWPATRMLALFASAFWIHYYLVHDVLGPLTIDELYFAHSFWLLREGLEQYSDFYSNHLPTYFWLLGPLVPPAPPHDLGFVWALRAAGALAALAYAALLYTLCRRDFLYLLPFLMLFIIFGRMTEIRTDTAGLLLFNAGWWFLLRGANRTGMLLAAACAAAAVFFSARAAVMIVGLAAICAWLCLRRRDFVTFGLLVLLALAFAAVVLAAYVADPATFALIIRSVFLDPTSLMPDLGVWNRVLPLDRLLLLSMVVVGTGAAALEIARGRADERAVVIAGAGVTQVLLILFDPSPFQYVYGWAMLPALAGIALLGRWSVRGLHTALGAIAAALAAVLLFLSLANRAAAGGPPPTGSVLRISYDAPIAREEIREAPTPRLLEMMVGMDRQQGLWNQLPLLSEICRRIDGPALTTFYANPICLHDARHDWPGLKWLAMFEGRGEPGTRREFEALIAERPPRLVAWGKQHYRPKLDSWWRGLLRDYAIFDGFALRRCAAPKGDGVSAAERRVGRSGTSVKSNCSIS